MLIGDADLEATWDRIAGELELLGFEVLRPGAEETLDPTLLAERHQAQAVVLLGKHPFRVVLWSSAQRSQQNTPTFSHSVTVQGTDSSESETLALRAVELLRGMLLKIRETTPNQDDVGTPERELVSPAQVAQSNRQSKNGQADAHQGPFKHTIVEATPGRLAVSLSPTLTFSPGGVAPLVGLALAASYRLHPWLRIGAAGVAPAGASSAGSPGGALSVRFFSFDAHILAAWEPISRLELSVGPGVSAFSLWWQRDSDSPDLDTQQQRWQPFFFGLASATFRLHPVVGLSLDSRLGATPHAIELTAPHPSTPAFIPQPAFGPLIFSSSLGIELYF